MTTAPGHGQSESGSRQVVAPPHVTPGLPRRLFKYMPIEGGLSLLQNQAFWYRCPLQFPDVQDSRANLFANLDVSVVRSEFRGALIRYLCGEPPPPIPVTPSGMLYHRLRERSGPWTPERVDQEFGSTFKCLFADPRAVTATVDRHIAGILADARVLCLCENCHSDRMWTEYADEGNGVCIGFQYVPEVDNAIGAAKQVNYVKSWPVVATPTELADHWLGIETIPFTTRAGDALYLKGDDYSHEQEWRVIDKPKPGTRADRDGVYRVHIDTREVVEIIVGSRVSVESASRIKLLCRERFLSVQVCQAS